MSRPYAEVIGDPIAHSKSPLIHSFWLGKLGIDAEYRACHVRPDELEGYFAARRVDPLWRGCNVTIPHKEAVLHCLDELEPSVRPVGAVNTVTKQDGRLIGTNTDIDGVAEAIAGIDGMLGDVVVLGAGGASRAAFACLQLRGFRSLRIVARNASKAAEATRGMEVNLHRFAAGTGAFESASLVINSTQLGMTGQQPMPQFVLDELACLAPGALVFDMVYAPLETALIKAARARGLSTADGLVMLVGQAASAFERFFGQRPLREHDAELREVLTR